MIIALFGGKFDPIHLGHVNLIQEVLARMPEIDQVWLVPARTHPWRKIHTSPADRWNMLKLLETDKTKVSDVDLVRPGPTRTIDTIKKLKKQYPTHHFYWICASDTIDRFDEWEDHHLLTQLMKFVVVPRPGFDRRRLPAGFCWIPGSDFPQCNFSSTQIRDRVKKGQAINKFVPREIEKYILSHKLYL